MCVENNIILNKNNNHIFYAHVTLTILKTITTDMGIVILWHGFIRELGKTFTVLKRSSISIAYYIHKLYSYLYQDIWIAVVSFEGR